MKNYLFLGLILCSPTLSLAKPIDHSCWDGTFAYNSMALRETQRGFEIGMTGSTLGPKTFRTFYETVAFGDWQQTGIYYIFGKSSCKEGEQSISCHEDFQTNLGRKNAWIERNVMDLDRSHRVLTSIPVSGASLEITESEATLTLHQNTSVDTNISQVISVNCYMPYYFRGELPQRLLDFLDQGSGH